MRVIFVGLHNKPDMMPLDILTKTGKLINRIIKELPKNIEIVKSNLFDIDRMPISSEYYDLMNEWYWTNLPVDDDIIVLLGAFNHKIFKFTELNVIKVAHPASKRSHEQMNEYVLKTSNKIIALIN